MKKIFIVILLLVGFSAQAEMSFEYTSVARKDCVTIDSDEMHEDAPIDFYTGSCEGRGNYEVVISGGDLRYGLDLSYKGIEIPTVWLSSFYDMGSNLIEWRYELKKGVKKYTALIYRLKFVDYTPDGQDGEKDMLVVMRLKKEKSCTIGKLVGLPNMNQKARDLADNPKSSCLQENDNKNLM